MFWRKNKELLWERIEAVALEKVAANEYMLTLENPTGHYENYYLWKYILRDVLLSVLADFDVCICAEESREKENLKQDFEMYEYKEDGDNLWLFCHDITAYTATILLEEYESVWEYDGTLHFYAKEKVGDERMTENSEHQVRMSSLKDSMGVSIIFSDKIEEELIKRIKKVINGYHLRLVIRGEGKG